MAARKGCHARGAHDYGVVHWGRGAGHVGSVRSRNWWAFALCPAMAPPDAHLRFSVGGCGRSRRPQLGSHVPLLPLLLVRGVLSEPRKLMAARKGCHARWAHDYGVVHWGRGAGHVGSVLSWSRWASPSALRWPLLTLTFGFPSVGVLGPAAPACFPRPVSSPLFGEMGVVSAE